MELGGIRVGAVWVEEIDAMRKGFGFKDQRRWPSGELTHRGMKWEGRALRSNLMTAASFVSRT